MIKKQRFTEERIILAPREQGEPLRTARRWPLVLQARDFRRHLLQLESQIRRYGGFGSEADQMLGSKEALRDLIEKIVVTPWEDGAGLDIDLHGAIAGFLQLATGVSARTPKSPRYEARALIFLTKNPQRMLRVCLYRWLRGQDLDTVLFQP